MRKNNLMLLGILGGLAFSFMLAIGSASAQTYAQIDGGTLSFGARNQNVRNLQTFLASNVDIYPQGLVTGYFGSLTREAVKQFQLYYDLDADGIAGPITKGKMNSLIASGYGLDIYAPAMNSLLVTPSGRNVTVTFSGSEPVKASFFYDSAAINYRDIDISFSTPVASGTVVTDTTLGSNKTLSASNLLPNTVYNYIVVATDASGNVTVTWPKTFKTGN